MIHPAVLRLTLRQYLGSHRLGLWAFLLALGALAPSVAAVTLEVARLEPELNIEGFREEFLMGLFTGFQLPLLYPIIALLLMSSALREEIQNETIPYLWLKPISRLSIVLSKYLGAIVIAVFVSGLSLMMTGRLLVSDWELIGNLLLTATVGLLAYGAFFFALSLVFERALIWGFLYILGWEELFSRISQAASQLSIRHYAENLGRELTGLPTDVALATSLGVLVGLTVVLLGIAIWRFRRMEFPGGGE